MKKSFDRRLEAIERQTSRNQLRAEREEFLGSAQLVVVAYHVGGLQPNGIVLEAYARALRYRNMDDLFSDVGRCYLGEIAAVWRIQLNHELALRAVFTKFQYERHPHDKFEEGLIAIAEQLPAEWIAWLDECVAQVDYVKKRQREEKVDRMLMAMAEGRTPP